MTSSRPAPRKPPRGQRSGAAYMRWYRAAVASGKKVRPRIKLTASQRRRRRREWMRDYQRERRASGR